jgi:peptidoglycan/xylan/chitin deacetylase (PgdA/CDA1 family)
LAVAPVRRRSPSPRAAWFFAVLIASLPLAPRPHAEPVALTYDDLPMLSLTEAPAYAQTTTRRLVASLRRRRVPAVGFVNGGKFEGDPALRRSLLRTWTRAGFELGNHTWSHLSLNEVTPAVFIDDIRRDDALLRSVGVRPRWFRHPYLETGPTPEAKTQVDSWLAAHRYRTAPVTLENADDVFALPYDDAVRRGDRAAAARIRSAYLAHTRRCIVWCRQASLELLGRRPALIFLLHASRLNADTVGALVRLLRGNHLHPVTLRQAAGDPAYGQRDEADRDGDDWLNRWAMTLGRELPWDSFPEPPVAIAAASAQLDPQL